MKLYEILTEDYTKRYTNFSDDEMQVAFDIINAEHGILSTKEIDEIAKEIAETERYPRNKGSAEFLLRRMHVLLKAEAPYGMTERSAEEMFMPSRRMEAFVDRRGINVHANIRNARQQLKTRPAGRRKKDEARKAMAKFYMANKENLPKDIVTHREEIVGKLIQGYTPQAAFAAYI